MLFDIWCYVIFIKVQLIKFAMSVFHGHCNTIVFNFSIENIFDKTTSMVFTIEDFFLPFTIFMVLLI